MNKNYSFDGFKNETHFYNQRQFINTIEDIKKYSISSEYDIEKELNETLKENKVKFLGAVASRNIGKKRKFVIFGQLDNQIYYWNFDCDDRGLYFQRGPFETLEKAKTDASWMGFYENTENLFNKIYESSRR